MSEIHDIMRQFNHGDGEWPLFIRSIKINNIHGWHEQEIVFKFPVVAIVGENGIGKSTFLKAAVCAYQNTAGKNYYPSQMFMSTSWDEAAMDRATIQYQIRHGNTNKVLTWRKTKDWGFAPRKHKPERDVYFLDISRTVPLNATAGYAKIAKESSETSKEEELQDRSIEGLSYVLGHRYSRGRFITTKTNEAREVGLLTNENGEISQFHQGAGEDSILDLFKLLQSIRNNSLLVIDEVENSLHPQAQRRLIKFLLTLSRVKKLQIILSTHSPFVLQELPAIARIMLMKLSDRKEVLYEISTQYAMSTIDEDRHPELFVHLEDDEAVSLFWEILKKDSANYDIFCKKITTRAVGNYSIVKTFDELSKSHKLPYKALAIVDGDKKGECPNCLSLPGDLAPERQVILGLKEKGWANLDGRFGIGAGTLFKILDDATLLLDHHQWTSAIGDKIKKSKDSVWSVLIEEWCKECLTDEIAQEFISAIHSALARDNDGIG